MSSDCDTGFYYIGDNTFGTTTGGSLRGTWSNTGLAVEQGLSAKYITSTGTIVGAAEGSVVYNLMVDATVAEINAGHTLITVPADRAFRLVDAVATAYGGACGTVTSVDLKVGATILASYAQANLTQSNRLHMSATGVTLLADGASYSAGAVGDDVTVIKAGDNADTCTGVRFVISYALE